MAKPRFVHLRLHSEYSVTDGIVRIDDAVRRAAADGMPALALTDAANLFGMVIALAPEHLKLATMLLKREGELAYEIGSVEQSSGGEPECLIA